MKLNRWQREARAAGYLAGLFGERPNRAFWPPDCRFQYDAGLADGRKCRPGCDQCNGTGRTPIGSDWQEEECALCNGTSKEYKI